MSASTRAEENALGFECILFSQYIWSHMPPQKDILDSTNASNGLWVQKLTSLNNSNQSLNHTCPWATFSSLLMTSFLFCSKVQHFLPMCHAEEFEQRYWCVSASQGQTRRVDLLPVDAACLPRKSSDQTCFSVRADIASPQPSSPQHTHTHTAAIPPPRPPAS